MHGLRWSRARLDDLRLCEVFDEFGVLSRTSVSIELNMCVEHSPENCFVFIVRLVCKICCEISDDDY